jgi:DNA-binding PadR family transcriptional regulator
MIDRDLKRGSTEMLIMAMVEDRPRHGYEIGKLIEQRSHGVLQFHSGFALSTALSPGKTRPD